MRRGSISAVYLSSDEYEAAKARAAALHKSFSAYVRDLIAGDIADSAPRETPCPSSEPSSTRS